MTTALRNDPRRALSPTVFLPRGHRRVDLGWDAVTPLEDMPRRSNSVTLTATSARRCLPSSKLVGSLGMPRMVRRFSVNYALHVGAVVFRTTPYGPLSVLVRRTPVAFEVDHIDLNLSLVGASW